MKNVLGLYHLEDSEANHDKAWQERKEIQKRLQA